MSSPEEREPVVRLRDVTKEFPGVLAVYHVNLETMPGENGAGKFTLMKLLSQVERPIEIGPWSGAGRCLYPAVA